MVKTQFINTTLKYNNYQSHYNNFNSISFNNLQISLQHHYQPKPLQHHQNTTNAMPRKLQFLKISFMDSTTTLAYQHLLFLHVSPATMFSTPTLYPLYHVKMDENKTKTLCTMHHHYSIHYSYTHAATACHQSISINTQTATSHFTLQLKSPCIAILCQPQIIAKRLLNSPYN